MEEVEKTRANDSATRVWGKRSGMATTTNQQNISFPYSDEDCSDYEDQEFYTQQVADDEEEDYDLPTKDDSFVITQDQKNQDELQASELADALNAKKHKDHRASLTEVQRRDEDYEDYQKWLQSVEAFENESSRTTRTNYIAAVKNHQINFQYTLRELVWQIVNLKLWLSKPRGIAQLGPIFTARAGHVKLMNIELAGERAVYKAEMEAEKKAQDKKDATESSIIEKKMIPLREAAARRSGWTKPGAFKSSGGRRKKRSENVADPVAALEYAKKQLATAWQPFHRKRALEDIKKYKMQIVTIASVKAAKAQVKRERVVSVVVDPNLKSDALTKREYREEIAAEDGRIGHRMPENAELTELEKENEKTDSKILNAALMAKFDRDERQAEIDALVAADVARVAKIAEDKKIAAAAAAAADAASYMRVNRRSRGRIPEPKILEIKMGACSVREEQGSLAVSANGDRRTTRDEACSMLTDKNKQATVLVKTRMCKSVAAKTACPYPEGKCRFAHSKDELQKRMCKFGRACNFVRWSDYHKAYRNSDTNKKNSKVCSCYHTGETEENFCQRQGLKFEKPVVVKIAPVMAEMPVLVKRPIVSAWGDEDVKVERKNAKKLMWDVKPAVVSVWDVKPAVVSVWDVKPAVVKKTRWDVVAPVAKTRWGPELSQYIVQSRKREYQQALQFEEDKIERSKVLAEQNRVNEEWEKKQKEEKEWTQVKRTRHHSSQSTRPHHSSPIRHHSSQSTRPHHSSPIRHHSSQSTRPHHSSPIRHNSSQSTRPHHSSPIRHHSSQSTRPHHSSPIRHHSSVLEKKLPVIQVPKNMVELVRQKMAGKAIVIGM
jgi:hypothetical protein